MVASQLLYKRQKVSHLQTDCVSASEITCWVSTTDFRRGERSGIEPSAFLVNAVYFLRLYPVGRILNEEKGGRQDGESGTVEAGFACVDQAGRRLTVEHRFFDADEF